MSWNQRFRAKVKKIFVTEEVDEQASAGAKPTQYRLEATRRTAKQNFFWKILTCCGLIGSSRRSSELSVGINPNQKLALYLHWMFRVNFVLLFSVMCLMFFALVIIFAAFITIAGRLDEDCVQIGGVPFAQAGTPFADAFALSWTTFSTVGYGSTYPALGYQNSSPTNCFFINFICSLESLVGVLYSGFCGAILFGKVSCRHVLGRMLCITYSLAPS